MADAAENAAAGSPALNSTEDTPMMAGLGQCCDSHTTEAQGCATAELMKEGTLHGEQLLWAGPNCSKALVGWVAQMVRQSTHEGHPAPVTQQSKGDLALDHGGTVKGKAGRTKINPI